MKKLYFLLTAFMFALVSLNAQLVVKWGDPDNYTIETELVDGNYFGENNGVYLWENGSQHKFIKIHGIDKNYLSGQDFNQFYFYVRVTDTQTYSDGQGGTVIGPRVNEDGYPVGIPGFDYYTVCESGEYQGVFYYYNYSEFMVGYTKPNGYYGSTRCNLSSYFNQTDGFSMGSITTGRLVVLQAENGTMAAQWIMGSGNVGAIIGEGGVVSKIDIPLTSDLVYNDNTGADAEWRYLQLSGTGNGSDNNNYNAAFYIKTGFKTGTFTSNDLDLTQTFLKQNGTSVEWTDVTVTITQNSTRVYSLIAAFIGTDGKTYNVTATYENCPPVETTTDPFAFANTELVNSVNVASGSKSTIYYLDWHRDGISGKRPCTRLVFCFYKSDMRYVNNRVYPPDGTYTFSSATNVPVWSVAAYRWVFSNTGYYSMYYDENSTKYYLNSGSVTVETKSDGVYVTINARGGTSTTSTNRSFNITIVPKFSGSTSDHKLDTYVNGRGAVTKSPDECLYAAGDKIILTPMPENSEWKFTGWTGECSDQITDNGNGTYTYTVPAKDCSVIANFEENAGYTLTWDFNGGITTSQDNEYTKGNVPEGEFIVAPADPTLEGYQFDGWFNSVTNNVEMAEGGMMPTQMPNNDLTYTAQWSKMQYVLAWDVNEGDALTGDYTQGEVEWGTAIIAPDDPTKEGYQFVGWVSSITNEMETPLEMPSADLTYTAQWAANTYTVHFDSNHGEAADEMGDQTFTYDVEQALTANGFEWTGHTFQGWATEANGNVVYADQQTVSNLTTENNATVNLYAVWSLDYVTVTFANPDGSELQSYQLSIGDVPAYEGTPVQENEGDEYNYFMYTFAGWIDGDNNSYGASDALPAVTGDITYTAQYNKNLFIVLQEDRDADYYTAFSDKYNGERATTVTLNRQFSQGKWATLCLPFNVNTALISALGMSNRVYEFKYTKGSETEGLTLYFSQAKKIEAGKGYIVNANSTMAKKTSFVFPAVVINTEADINSGFDISNLEGYNSQGTVYLVGTLRTGLLLGSQTGSRYMGLKDNKIYYPNTAQGTSVRAYRGIFRNTEDAPVSRVRIVVEGEDGEMVDELEVVNGEIEDTDTTRKVILNGILYIERNGELFDAQGKRLE